MPAYTKVQRDCFGEALKVMKKRYHQTCNNPYAFIHKNEAEDDYITAPALDECGSYIRYSMVAATENKQMQDDRFDLPIRIELVFVKPNGKDWNKEMMEALKKYQDGIETSFKGLLEDGFKDSYKGFKWKAKVGRGEKSQKIVYESEDFQYGLDEKNCADVAKWLADNMLRFAQALKPYIIKLEL